MEPTLYTDTYAPASSSLFLSPFYWLFILFLFVVGVVGIWKIFVKAGRPGWHALIPLYNIYALFQITGHSGLWLLAFFVPILNFVASIMLGIWLARAFGKSALYGIVMLWLFSFIGYLILGFGGAQYVGAVNPAPVLPTPEPPTPTVPTT